MYVLDSCICIDAMRGKLPYALRIMRNSDPARFSVPAIALGELCVGAEKSRNPLKNKELLSRFVEPLQVLEFDAECARVYGQLRASLEKTGVRIGGHDLQIAATALRYNGVLVSNNTRDFGRIPGLSFECWYEVDLGD